MTTSELTEASRLLSGVPRARTQEMCDCFIPSETLFDVESAASTLME